MKLANDIVDPTSNESKITHIKIPENGNNQSQIRALEFFRIKKIAGKLNAAITPIIERSKIVIISAERQKCGTAEFGRPERSERETLPAVATTDLFG